MAEGAIRADAPVGMFYQNHDAVEKMIVSVAFFSQLIYALHALLCKARAARDPRGQDRLQGLSLLDRPNLYWSLGLGLLTPNRPPGLRPTSKLVSPS